MMQKEPTLAQKLVAEFIGTGLLTLIGAGSVTATLTLEAGSGAKFSEADLGVIALAFGFIITAMVFAVGKISGCHINPAVTIALLLTGRIDVVSAAEYIVAQFLGAVAGAFGIVAMFGTHAASSSILGVTSYGASVPAIQAIVAEAIGTFILVFTIYGVAVDPRAPAGWAGLVIGLIVAGIIFVLGPVTGASLNPARTFGTTFVQAILGGTNYFNQYIVYILGPVIGGALGAFAYDFLARPKAAAAESAPVEAAKAAASHR
ncbi:MAG: MIP/aquaporin family protein [Ktedonobacterales bacterium]